MSAENQKTNHDESVMAADQAAEALGEGDIEEAPGEALETEGNDAGVDESEGRPAGDPDEEALSAKLEKAQEEAKDIHSRLLRVSAEFENYKKRSARETEAFRKYANESLLKALLPVVDNLERAIESFHENSGTEACIIEGVEMTHKEILKVLEKFGVEPIESVGKPFDPSFHEAAMRQPSADHPENTVIKEFHKGYMLHDRLLRPAMVVVSSKESN